MYILGFCGLNNPYHPQMGHDGSATLLKNGQIICAAEEERFDRVKHSHNFPVNAISFCLDYAGIKINEIDYFCFYFDMNYLKFAKLLYNLFKSSTARYIFHKSDFNSFRAYYKAQSECYSKKALLKLFKNGFNYNLAENKLKLIPHQICHAASAYYCSGFHSSDILTMDQSGENSSAIFAKGIKNKLQLEKSIYLPTSMGILYAAVTTFLGFKHHEDEYKVMGLAPYGNKLIFENFFSKLVRFKKAGSYEVSPLINNYRYLESFKHNGISEETIQFFEENFGPRRTPEAEITERDKDIAAALQHITEKVMLHALGFFEKKRSGNLGLAGGVFLNCSANGKILAKQLYDRIFIQPASNDAGTSIGAALYFYHHVLNNPLIYRGKFTTYLGPSYQKEEISGSLQKYNKEVSWELPSNIFETSAKLIAEGNIIAWFQGRMEFGPRALGNRSILADPRVPDMKDKINKCIKKRESFRPFAPSVLEEYSSEYFETYGVTDLYYMLFALPVKNRKIPAVTHVNNTARIHAVSKTENLRYHQLITEFHKQTGVSVVLNTSFNVRSEPIVCTPEDAIKCFLNTDLDALVIEDYLVKKR